VINQHRRERHPTRARKAASIAVSFRWRDEPLRLAAAAARQERVWIDRGALPPAFAGRHGIDREVEMRPVRAGVAGAADEAERGPALHLLAFGETRRVAVEMRVIIHPAHAGRADIGGDAADAPA